MQLISRIIRYVQKANKSDNLRTNFINELSSIIRHSMTWLSKATEFDNQTNGKNENHLQSM